MINKKDIESIGWRRHNHFNHPLFFSKKDYWLIYFWENNSAIIAQLSDDRINYKNILFKGKLNNINQIKDII